MLNSYQKRIVAFYTQRTNYDNDFTRDRALRLLVDAPVELGQSVLDVATGTGFVAIAAAANVGKTGSVLGIDITPDYLAKAQVKCDLLGIHNLTLREIDEAELDAAPESFDRIYCSSAIVLFPDIPATLKRWHKWLKPGGIAAFSCSTDTSFFTPQVIAACLSQGIDLPNLHVPLGTIDHCHAQCQAAGFAQVEVNTIDLGEWMSLTIAQNRWNGRMWFHPQDPLPNLPAETTDRIKAEFDRQIAAIATAQGVWHEHLAFYVTAHKR